MEASKSTVNRYFTSDSDPDFKYCPFPRLADKRKHLLNEYYEAEFMGDNNKALALKKEIEYIEISINLGEEYDIPF
jgi:hypothetical protein